MIRRRRRLCFRLTFDEEGAVLASAARKLEGRLVNFDPYRAGRLLDEKTKSASDNNAPPWEGRFVRHAISCQTKAIG